MYMTSDLEIKKLIKEVGLKNTLSRTAVLKHLKQVNRPISHSELVQRLNEQYGDQATIYRTLLTFVKVGLLRIASRVNGITYYELYNSEATEHHPHFVCQQCASVSCLPTTTIVRTLEDKWKEAIRHAEVQFVGICPNCI